MKPQNVLLESNEDDKYEIKIADFGFSCFYDPNSGLETVLGSALYMAPELVKKEKYNEKVDVWAIGMMACLILTGEPPFPG